MLQELDLLAILLRSSDFKCMIVLEQLAYPVVKFFEVILTSIPTRFWQIYCLNFRPYLAHRLSPNLFLDMLYVFAKHGFGILYISRGITP